MIQNVLYFQLVSYWIRIFDLPCPETFIRNKNDAMFEFTVALYFHIMLVISSKYAHAIELHH